VGVVWKGVIGAISGRLEGVSGLSQGRRLSHSRASAKEYLLPGVSATQASSTGVSFLPSGSSLHVCIVGCSSVWRLGPGRRQLICWSVRLWLLLCHVRI
jgi:hypothetical protein